MINTKDMKLDILKVGVTLILVVGLFSCNNRGRGDRNNSQIPVWVESVEYKNIEKYITTTATAKAKDEAILKTEITGKYILQINPRTGKKYKLGDIVEKGDVIIKLENVEYKNNIQLESKKLQVDIALRERQGQKILFEKGGSTEKEVNMAENSYINAVTAYENAQLSVDKMSVRAKFKGVIVDLPYFTEGIEVPTGTIALGLMNYYKMYISTKFPESSLTTLKVGQKVHITNYNIGNDTLQGRISQLSPAIDEKTRTFLGFIEIDNPKLKLRPGMFTKADVVTDSRRHVIVIPKSIVSTWNTNETSIFVIEKSTVKKVNIKLGLSDDNYIEVKEGLKKGDKIVVKGYEWLRNGSNIKIMKY